MVDYGDVDFEVPEIDIVPTQKSIFRSLSSLFGSNNKDRKSTI